MRELDCGDNSCIFAKNKGGMRTNGGCRCFSVHGFDRSVMTSAMKMLPLYLDQKEEITRLKAEREKLVKVIRFYAHEEIRKGFEVSGIMPGHKFDIGCSACEEQNKGKRAREILKEIGE